MSVNATDKRDAIIVIDSRDRFPIADNARNNRLVDILAFQDILCVIADESHPHHAKAIEYLSIYRSAHAGVKNVEIIYAPSQVL